MTQETDRGGAPTEAAISDLPGVIHCCPNVPEEYETPHQFETTEWNCGKEELVAAFAVFYTNIIVPARTTPFQEMEWAKAYWPCVWSDEVKYFLHCTFHLVRGAVMPHHVRCVLTLIRQGYAQLPEPGRRSA